MGPALTWHGTAQALTTSCAWLPACLQIPHYNLEAATEAVKPVMGPYYREPEKSNSWFPTHLFAPLVRSFKHDHFVADSGNIVYYEVSAACMHACMVGSADGKRAWAGFAARATHPCCIAWRGVRAARGMIWVDNAGRVAKCCPWHCVLVFT